VTALLEVEALRVRLPTAAGPATVVAGDNHTINVEWSGLTPGLKYLGTITHHRLPAPVAPGSPRIAHTSVFIDVPATTTAVPDVTGQDVSVAQTILDGEGFRTRVEFEDTDDPTLDGIVTSQDPAGGTQQKPSSIIVLFVGRFVGTTTESTQTTPEP